MGEGKVNVFITGVNGFLGKHLARKLHQQGHIIQGLGRQAQPLVPVDHYFSGDVCNKNDVREAARGADALVHLAAVTTHQEITAEKEKALQISFQGMQNVLQVAAELGIKKVLLSSSGKVYGSFDPAQLPLTEDLLPRPQNILGKIKYLTEQLMDFYASSQNSLVVLRIFNVYGPDQHPQFLIPTILRQIQPRNKEEEEVITLGDVTAQRDYVFVDDVVQALILALEKEMPPGLSIWNVCSQQGTSAQEIVQEVSRLLGKSLKVRGDEQRVRYDEQHQEYGSYQKISALGWKPQVSLAEGLRRILEKQGKS